MFRCRTNWLSMKNLTLIGLSILFLISCDKEEVLDPVSEQEDAKVFNGEERYESDFENYLAKLRVTLGSANSCNNPHSFISLVYSYQLKEGVSQNGQYFYELHRKTNYQYDAPYVVDWQNTGMYYRYDYDNKKAYMYDGLNDATPKLLMDFNAGEGDTLTLNAGGIMFKVDQVGYEVIGGQNYPVLLGHLHVNPAERSSGPSTVSYNLRESQNWLSNVKSTIKLSPYYPNPLSFDHNMYYYWSHDWNFDDFDHNAIYEPYRKGFTIQSLNTIDGVSENDYYVVLK